MRACIAARFFRCLSVNAAVGVPVTAGVVVAIVVGVVRLAISIHDDRIKSLFPGGRDYV